MLLVVEDGSVLLQAKCRSTSGAGVCGRCGLGSIYLSLPTVHATVYDKL